MFTGIVTEMGVVGAVAPSGAGSRLAVEAPLTRSAMRIGDSVAINGVCLTAVAIEDEGFSLDVVQETLSRSNLGRLVAGSHVNLERPMAGHGRFDGHIVQGHVDGVGTLASVEPEGTAYRVRIVVPQHLARYLVEKGSVTVDGVSLTVTAVSPVDAADPWFEVVLIPHTLEVTVLGHRRPSDEVNLEVDVIAKYVERLMEAMA